MKFELTKNRILIGLGILLLAIFGRFISLISFPESGGYLEKEEWVKLAPEESFRQSIISSQNNLAKAEFIIRSPGIKPPDKVKVKLADESCSAVIREGYLEPSFLDSKNLYVFWFAPIPDSVNKNYCLTAAFKPTNSNAKSIRFFGKVDPGKFFENITTKEKYEDRSLSIRLAYKGNFLENIDELNKRISQYKPWFLKHYFLYFIAFGFLILSIILVAFLIILL